MEATLANQAMKPVNPSRIAGAFRFLRFRAVRCWRRFWLARSGPQGFGRVAAWLASRHSLPYHQMSYLADIYPRGFVASRARVNHPGLRLGEHVYLGDGVIIHSTSQGGPVELGSRVCLYGDTFVETGMSGSILIDEGTHIQPGCHLHAFLSEIRIGKKVEIAPRCGFYCYDHGMAPGIPIMDQPLQSKGGISVGDGAWIGYGVTVLQGVTIGEGAVIAAGSVVVHDIPDDAIAAGAPAKVLKFRDGTRPTAG
jgi:acetyltransferase-like isoleucine patch superfamily enzyme